MTQKKIREDHIGPHRRVYEKNRGRVFATQDVCAICGRPVDFALKFPDPMSATIDHIIPISQGGHPSDIENMQLAHLTCNEKKGSMRQAATRAKMKKEIISNRMLPQSRDWSKYKDSEV